jgi:hypothetical protein
MALPNLRRLFVEARTEAEENEYSRNAVSRYHFSRASEARTPRAMLTRLSQFYNLVLFISSVAVFSLVAQRMSGHKAIK